MSTQVTPAERLLDLVIALTHTTHRMTRSQIRRSVNGYAQAPSLEAFERMFERDKETLRSLGIPLVTLVDDAHGDDIGYRIDLEGYELPAIELTAEEIGVLSVAAQVWQGADLDGRARRALTKLRAVAPLASEDLAGHVLRIPTPEVQVDPLLEAASHGLRALFTYRAARSGSTELREVEPWRLLVRDGAWYLQAWDLAREGERLFRLSRITGAVRLEPIPDGVRHPVGPAPVPPADAGEARLLVRPERAASLRLRATAVTPAAESGRDAGDDLVTLPVGDLEDLAALVAGHTDAVVVLSPPRLRRAVVDRLRAVAALAPPDQAGKVQANA